MLVDRWGNQLAPVDMRAGHAGSSVVPGPPPGYRYHDLRHYVVWLLISKGADVKVVQARLRHSSAKATLTRTSGPNLTTRPGSPST